MLRRNNLVKLGICGFLLMGLDSCTNSPTPGSLKAVESKITLGGSAEGYEVLEILTEAYSDREEGIEFEYFPPGQTDGAIEGVKKQVLDIGSVSRAITDEEKGDGLTYLPLVKTPLVLVVHESVEGVTDITTEQIKAIYSGEISNWKELQGPDAPIIILDYPEDENEKKVLRESYLGADLEVTADAIVFREDDELIEAAAITEFSIVAIPFEEELEELPVSILSIDGIQPSTENLISGEYVMGITLGIILPQESSSTVIDFLEFVKSAEGQQRLAEEGYITLSNE